MRCVRVWVCVLCVCVCFSFYSNIYSLQQEFLFSIILLFFFTALKIKIGRKNWILNLVFWISFRFLDVKTKICGRKMFFKGVPKVFDFEFSFFLFCCVSICCCCCCSLLLLFEVCWERFWVVSQRACVCSSYDYSLSLFLSLYPFSFTLFKYIKDLHFTFKFFSYKISLIVV